jgi:hypothetical protein
VLVKFDFCDAQAYYLARFLGRLPSDAPVSLIGYSLGARMAIDALALLAGDRIADLGLPPEAVAQRMRQHPRPYRVVLVAAASDADWLLPGHRDAAALALVDRMLVTVNPCDRVLRRYPRLYGRGGPEAMGCVGPYVAPGAGTCAPPCAAPRSDQGDKIEVIDVASSVGRRHDWYRYATAPELTERLGWYTFLEPAAAD